MFTRNFIFLLIPFLLSFTAVANENGTSEYSQFLVVMEGSIDDSFESFNGNYSFIEKSMDEVPFCGEGYHAVYIRNSYYEGYLCFRDGCNGLRCN